MSAYTLLQLFEILIGAVLVMYGIVANGPIIALVGAGYLIGTALLNVLAPEGGTIYRRSVIGYAVGGVFVIAGALLVHFR